MRALLMVLAIVAIAALSASAQGKAPAAPGSLVNLNTATQAQLEALPGLGAAVAQRIVEYREKNGHFKKIDEILETSRSGPSLLTTSRLSAHDL